MVSPVGERDTQRKTETERERERERQRKRRKRGGGTDELQTVGEAESCTSIPVLHSDTWKERVQLESPMPSDAAVKCTHKQGWAPSERKFVIDNLLVRIHLII